MFPFYIPLGNIIILRVDSFRLYLSWRQGSIRLTNKHFGFILARPVYVGMFTRPTDSELVCFFSWYTGTLALSNAVLLALAYGSHQGGTPARWHVFALATGTPRFTVRGKSTATNSRCVDSPSYWSTCSLSCTEPSRTFYVRTLVVIKPLEVLHGFRNRRREVRLEH